MVFVLAALLAGLLAGFWCSTVVVMRTRLICSTTSCVAKLHQKVEVVIIRTAKKFNAYNELQGDIFPLLLNYKRLFSSNRTPDELSLRPGHGLSFSEALLR